MRPAARQGTRGVAKPPLFSRLRRRDARTPLTIQIRYRGGSEAWYLVEARGARQAFPGHMCIHDVMRTVNQSDSYR